MTVLQIERGEVEYFLISPELDDATFPQPAAAGDVVDMRDDVGFGPGVGLAAVKAMIAAVAVLALAGNEIHDIAVCPDVDRNILAGRCVTLCLQRLEQFIVNFLEGFRGLFGQRNKKGSAQESEQVVD